MSEEGHPYRTPWAPAERLTHPGTYRTSEELRRELIVLRERVDSGRLGDISPEDLAASIRDLVEARDRLRQAARPVRASLVYVAGLFGAAGTILAFARLHDLAWLALTIAALTTVVAAVASEWVQRWLDAIPEYEGLIADLRKVAASRVGPGAEALSPEEMGAVEKVRAAARSREQLRVTVAAATEALRPPEGSPALAVPVLEPEDLRRIGQDPPRVRVAPPEEKGETAPAASPPGGSQRKKGERP